MLIHILTSRLFKAEHKCSINYSIERNFIKKFTVVLNSGFFFLLYSYHHGIWDKSLGLCLSQLTYKMETYTSAYFIRIWHGLNEIIAIRPTSGIQEVVTSVTSFAQLSV